MSSVLVGLILWPNLPGNRPASNTPRKTRQTTRPAKDCVTPWQTVMMPTSVVSIRAFRPTILRRTPEEHDATQPGRWSDFLHDDIGRHLKKDVWDEEHEESDVVIFSLHVKVFGQALDLSIADVDSGEVSVPFYSRLLPELTCRRKRR